MLDLVEKPADRFSRDVAYKANDISSCTCAQQRRKLTLAKNEI